MLYSAAFSSSRGCVEADLAGAAMIVDAGDVVVYDEGRRELVGRPSG